MKIDVAITYLRHKGGTKFYQVFQFKPEGGRPITLTHYGPIGTEPSHGMRRPVLGGTTQIHSGAVLMSKISAKEKRGYVREDGMQTTMLDGIESHWWVHHFGAALAHELEVAMFLDEMVAMRGMPSVKEDNEFVPSALAPIESRPESWGSW